MKRFFSTLLAVLVGLLLFNLFIFMCFVSLIGAALVETQEQSLQEHSILKIDLSEHKAPHPPRSHRGDTPRGRRPKHRGHSPTGKPARHGASQC